MKGIALYNESFPIIKVDTKILKENIIRILLTSPGERVNNPLFGSRLKEMLFEIESVAKDILEREVRTSISKWEPRVAIHEIKTEYLEENRYLLAITCTSLETYEIFTLEKILRL